MTRTSPGRGRHRPAVLACVLGCMLVLLPSLSLGREGSIEEAQVKAAFLFNFLKFTDWPEETFGDPEDTLVIGVLGSGAFHDALVEAVRDKTVHDRSVRVSSIRAQDDLSGIQAVFITASERRHVPHLLSRLGSNPVLTVSETEGFLQTGGMINFFVREKRVRFEVRPRSVAAAGLRIRSQLLQLAANIVDEPGE